VCVLLVHHRVRSDAPIVLLANRDEAYDRAFDPPALRPGPAGIVAPRDRAAGGTWLGVNARGLVAAITNRPAKPGLDVRSRGLLVADVLERDDVPAARAWLDAHLDTVAYDPFNLMVLDRAAGFVLHHEREGSVLVDLSPGVHVLTNLHDLDVAPVPDAGAPRAGEPLAHLLARLERLAGDTTTPLPGDHRIDKRGPVRGTVCSAVLAVPAETGARPTFRFANGPPDTTPFRRVIV
jgi:uncharacterized protein with NRDE domain